MSVEVIDFQDALEDAKNTNDECHMLVGNGFSIAADPRFNYDCLYKKAKQGLGRRVKALFDCYGTTGLRESFKTTQRGPMDCRTVRAGTNETVEHGGGLRVA